MDVQSKLRANSGDNVAPGSLDYFAATLLASEREIERLRYFREVADRLSKSAEEVASLKSLGLLPGRWLMVPREPDTTRSATIAEAWARICGDRIKPAFPGRYGALGGRFLQEGEWYYVLNGDELREHVLGPNAFSARGLKLLDKLQEASGWVRIAHGHCPVLAVRCKRCSTEYAHYTRTQRASACPSCSNVSRPFLSTVRAPLLFWLLTGAVVAGILLRS